jgi:hypothetical protein
MTYSIWFDLTVALAIGLLIGLERERNNAAFLQPAYLLVSYAKICYNLACSEDHLVSNASLAFPPKTWTAGFSGPFFFDTHTQLEEKPPEDSWRL